MFGLGSRPVWRDVMKHRTFDHSEASFRGVWETQKHGRSNSLDLVQAGKCTSPGWQSTLKIPPKTTQTLLWIKKYIFLSMFDVLKKRFVLDILIRWYRCSSRVLLDLGISWILWSLFDLLFSEIAEESLRSLLFFVVPYSFYPRKMRQYIPGM